MHNTRAPSLALYVTDPDAAGSPTEEPLFCPFCRDTYEATDVCPTHGLALVRFMDLPASKEPEPPWPDADPLPRWSPRFGRAFVGLGALVVLASFWLPWVRLFQPREVDVTAFVMARQALNLWSIPLAATTLLVILATRRSPIKMRGARLAAALIALMPLGNLGLTFFKVSRAATELGTRVEASWGPAVLLGGVVLALAGAWRLGRRSPSEIDALRDQPTSTSMPEDEPEEPPTVH